MFCIFYDQVGVKKQALEQVASEFEVLEKDKHEIQQWISDVKKELSTTADQEDKNPDVVIRRRKLKVCLKKSILEVSRAWFSMLRRAIPLGKFYVQMDNPRATTGHKAFLQLTTTTTKRKQLHLDFNVQKIFIL